MQHFTDLKVWQRSHAVVLGLYRLTSGFPADERFGLTSQLRRAAASVPTNIAEGAKRIGRQDYARFLNIAQGSLAETEYLTMLSRDLGYIAPEKSKAILAEISEIAGMLHGLRKKVEGGSSWLPNADCRLPTLVNTEEYDHDSRRNHPKASNVFVEVHNDVLQRPARD